jgi:hypothetical protein
MALHMRPHVTPQDAPCGAVVRGVNLSQPLDAATSAAIRSAWLQHQVLAFVDQAMTLEDLERFALTIGPYGQDPYFESVPGHPHVAQVRPTFHKVVDCQWACPAHTPVPEYIRLIARGATTTPTWSTGSNVFPGILGRTCDRPCEPACRRGRVEEENGGKPEPVAICRLKRVAADFKGDEVRAHARARSRERQARGLRRRRARRR